MGGSSSPIARIIEDVVLAPILAPVEAVNAVVEAAGGGDVVDAARNKVDPVRGVDNIVNGPARAAEAAAKDQQQQVSRAKNDLNARAAADDASAAAIQARDDARRRARMLARGGGRRDTILTGQSGVTADTGVGRKTLLGA